MKGIVVGECNFLDKSQLQKACAPGSRCRVESAMNKVLKVCPRWEIIVKFRMDNILQFWIDVAVEQVKSDHANLTKRQLVAQILREYERRGDALRCLNKHGRIGWKASPRFLTMLADAERDARDDLAEFP
jgi:hypothetical protein